MVALIPLLPRDRLALEVYLELERNPGVTTDCGKHDLAPRVDTSVGKTLSMQLLKRERKGRERENSRNRHRRYRALPARFIYGNFMRTADRS